MTKATTPRSQRSPWEGLPSEELSEQLLPRWFAILGVVLVPIAVVVTVYAFIQFSPADVPPAERRPPPTDELSHDVGVFEVDEAPDERVQSRCAELDGIRVMGTGEQRADLRRAVAALCQALPEDAAEDVAALTDADAVVRFARFERTGVDSAVRVAGADAAPEILINARMSLTSPLRIAPLIVHDAVLLAHGPGEAEAAVRAREAELAVCRRVLGTTEPSAGCEAAAELLASDDPAADLRAAGYR